MTENPPPIEEEFIPQPQYGITDPQSLELTKFMVTDDPFVYEEGQDGNDEKIIYGDIPPKMLNYFWGFLSKDNVLTYNDQTGLQLAVLRFKKAKLAYIMSTARHEFTYETIRHLNNLEQKFIARIKRSRHGFERKQQTTQTSATLYGSVDQHDAEQRKPNYGPLGLGRLFGR